MAAAKLEELKKVDVRTVDVSTLEDIGKIRIDRTLPKEERLLAFAREVKNPFALFVTVWWSKHPIPIRRKVLKMCLQSYVLKWQRFNGIMKMSGLSMDCFSAK